MFYTVADIVKSILAFFLLVLMGPHEPFDELWTQAKEKPEKKVIKALPFLSEP